jgi:acyl carrier protein
MASAWGISTDTIPPEAQLNEFAPWDSMGHVSLMLALEERLGVKINFATISRLTSVPAILDYLEASEQEEPHRQPR